MQKSMKLLLLNYFLLSEIRMASRPNLHIIDFQMNFWTLFIVIVASALAFINFINNLLWPPQISTNQEQWGKVLADQYPIGETSKAMLLIFALLPVVFVP